MGQPPQYPPSVAIGRNAHPSTGGFRVFAFPPRFPVIRLSRSVSGTLLGSGWR